MNIVKDYGRIILALIVVIAISALLNFEAPSLEPDFGNYEEHAFWLQVESSIAYFIAVTAGAIVARRNFLVPAFALAVLGWSSVVYILYDISNVGGSASIRRIALDNLEGLILYGIAAVLGAGLGAWFYKHEIEQVGATS